MARAQRRSTRSSVRQPSLSPLSSRSTTQEPTPTETTQPAQSYSNGDMCPACSTDKTETMSSFEKENWIRCDVCNTWYHWRCAGNGEDVEIIDKWYCKSCLEADPNLVITNKAPARKSSRKRARRDYATLNSGLGSDASRWTRMLEGKDIKTHPFKHMQGSAVDLSWLDEEDGAFTEPIIIEKPEGLGMKMPPKDFTVQDVVKLVGEQTPVEVIDVASQSTAPGWTLGKWAEYFNLEPSKREKILNVISLEVSGTKLADMILPPKIVRDLDWVENYWPSTRKGKGHVYPKVQLYCLMGVAMAWTDWHIDFAGSSVYYHILHGSKVFYFIKPTSANLAAYEQWSGTDLQYHMWLGDMVDEVYRVDLTEGNTMIIPTGWIHAVYTPVDTLVFGGNFLHSYNVSTQLRVRNIEIATQVPKKFRFPMFSKLCWYVGDKFLRDLKAHPDSNIPSRVLTSLLDLAEFLVSEVRIIEKGTEQAKKEVKEQIPSDRVKDAASMARELRWRLRLIGGYSSDGEGAGMRKSADGVGYLPNGAKRRRTEPIDSETVSQTGRFKNFKPKAWDGFTEMKETASRRTTRATKPFATDDSGTWTKDWLDGTSLESAEGAEAQVDTWQNVVVKVKRNKNGIERHRIERTVEQWSWDEIGKV